MRNNALIFSLGVVLFGCGPQPGSTGAGTSSATVPGFPSTVGGGGGGAPAGGGGAMMGGGSGVATGGGTGAVASGGGAVDESNHAEDFWNLVTTSRQRIFDLESDEARRPLYWLRVASQAAGHVVTSGALVEDAQGQFTFSPEGVTLRVTRANGASFDVYVHSVSGDLTDADFPGNQDSLYTDLELSDGRVWYSRIWGDLGPAYEHQTHTSVSGLFDDDSGDQVDVSFDSLSSTSGNADTTGTVTIAERQLNGTLVLGATTVALEFSSFFSSCSGAYACASRYESSDTSVHVSSDASTLAADWTRKVTVQTLGSPGTVVWSGSITRDGSAAGSMTKVALVQNEVALDVQLDGDVWVTETVFGN